MEAINKLFTETLKLSAGIWLVILLAVVVVAFAVSLIGGIMTGEFKTVKGLMAQVVSKPSNALSCLKKMPTPISKQYKRARVANLKPSDYVTEQECVYVPYAHSLISKVWLVTFVATVICAAIGFLVAPLALAAAEADSLNTGAEVNHAVLENASYTIPIVILIVGGLLTLVGGILGRVFYGGAKKVYAKFVDAIDGDADKPATEPEKFAAHNDMNATFEQPVDPVMTDSVIGAEPMGESVAFGDVITETETPIVEQNDFGFAAEPVQEEPVFAQSFEPAAPVETESDEDIRMRAREEAIARMKAEQEAQEAARMEQERKAAEEAEARARAEAEAQAQAQAAQAAQAQAAQSPQSASTSSADDVIARIEQINREGAPRETMREVATLLQKERAKPENKTPEQQKKLNEALSKLLKAMSAANKK